MRPVKTGQIVKFHTPFSDEDTDQLYVVLELYDDVERPRAHIQTLNTGFPFPLISTVLVEDIEVAEVDVSGLTGHKAIINTSDNSTVTGTVVNVSV